MALALNGEHRAFAEVVEAYCSRRPLLAAVRAAYAGQPDALETEREGLARQGWLGVHLPERHGGQGYGLAELAIVIEGLARVLAASTVLPTVVASATLLEV